jgi:hypothetical protein
MHKITKTYLTNLVDEGLTIEQIVARISKDFNETISVNLVRAGLKNFGLQTRRNKFMFVDDTNVVASPNQELEEALADYNPHDDLPFGI